MVRNQSILATDSSNTTPLSAQWVLDELKKQYADKIKLLESVIAEKGVTIAEIKVCR